MPLLAIEASGKMGERRAPSGSCRKHHRPSRGGRQQKCKKSIEDTKKEVQISPKSNPRDYPKAKKHSGAARARKKAILGGRVRHRARQEDPKLDLQTEPRAPKNEDLHLIPKGIGLEASVEATD